VHGGLLLPSRIDERNINHLSNGHVVRVRGVDMHELWTGDLLECNRCDILGDLHKLRRGNVQRGDGCNGVQYLCDMWYGHMVCSGCVGVHKLRRGNLFHGNRCDRVGDLPDLLGRLVVSGGRIGVHELYRGHLLQCDWCDRVGDVHPVFRGDILECRGCDVLGHLHTVFRGDVL